MNTSYRMNDHSNYVKAQLIPLGNYLLHLCAFKLSLSNRFVALGKQFNYSGKSDRAPMLKFPATPSIDHPLTDQATLATPHEQAAP
jgi:hypothetical protein